MGAWGVHPLESDQGGELVCTAFKNLYKTVDRALRRPVKGRTAYYYGWDVRAAATLLELCGYALVWPGSNGGLGDTDVLREHLQLAVTRLDELLQDDEYIGTWSDEHAIRKDIARQIDTLRERLRGDLALPGTQTLGTKLETIAERRPRSRRGSSARKTAKKRAKVKAKKKG